MTDMKHPYRAEAIQIVRDRAAAKGDPLDDMPDEAVAKLFVTPHVEFRLARQALYRAVLDALPARVQKWLGKNPRGVA